MKKILNKLTKLFLILIIIICHTKILRAEEYKTNRSFIHPDEVMIEKALENAREIVRMLDDMYKAFIVLITKKYVKDPDLFSAATLAKMVFESMSKKGWHEARLLSIDEFPNNPDNYPRNDFEREAIKAITSGKTYYEKVKKDNNNYYLMAATSVAAVEKGCIICHPGKKTGDLLGAISYKISLNKYFR